MEPPPPLWKSWLHPYSKLILIGGRIENFEALFHIHGYYPTIWPNEINVLTTRSSAGMGTFSLSLNLTFISFSPINRKRQSRPVITAPTFAEGMFFIIWIKIWKQLSSSFVWIIEKVSSITNSRLLVRASLDLGRKIYLGKNPILKFSGAREERKYIREV